MTGRGDILAGRYRVVAPLAPVGGVPRDLAVDTVADGQVEVARFARSGTVPAGFSELVSRHQAVRHPCLAPILAWTEPGEDLAVDPLVVEQHVEGARLGTGVVLPRRTALLVGADAADALAALHAAGLVHGAMAPEAVVLDRAGRAIVSGGGTGLLQAAALGSAAPEADPASDVRSLGRMLYALVCGRAPAQPPAAPVEIAPDIEPALNGLLLAMLTDDPTRPPPPASAVGLRLRDLAGEPAIEGPRSVAVVAAARPGMRRGPLPAAGFALLLGTAAIAILGIVAAFAVTRNKDEAATETITVVSTTTYTGQKPTGVPPTVVVVPSGSTVYAPAGPTTVYGNATGTVTLPYSVIVSTVYKTTQVTKTGPTTVTTPFTYTIPAVTTTFTTPVTLTGF
jgi:hypothetical protein